MASTSKPIFKRLINGLKLLSNGRPRSLPLIRAAVAGKAGIEIGGPSAIFRNWYHLPLYDTVGSLDNCDFARSTTWAIHESSYHYSKRAAPGRTYVSEGSDLNQIADAQYDFVLSSHNLEHFANPIKGLEEWQRILRSGGHLVLVLPHYQRTFDHRRTPTPVSHMVQDHQQQMGEDDLTHVDEVFQAHRLNEGHTSDDELRQLLATNHTHRMMHHHVFDESNSRELLEAAGMNVLSVETMPPFHIILLAQKRK